MAIVLSIVAAVARVQGVAAGDVIFLGLLLLLIVIAATVHRMRQTRLARLPNTAFAVERRAEPRRPGIARRGSAESPRPGARPPTPLRSVPPALRPHLETEQRFLADVGAVLSSTLDYDETLTNIGNLAVRDLADLCVIDEVDDEGRSRRLRVIDRDPGRAWLADLLMQVPPGRSPSLVRAALDGRRSIVVDRVGEGTVEGLAYGADQEKALRDAGLESVVIVPLLAHGRLVGAITLMSCSPSRRYRAGSVGVAEELSQRAALSMAHARLFREAQRAVQIRDDVMAVVSHDLRNPVTTIGLLAQRLKQPSGSRPDQVADVADSINREVDDMHLLIDDLLDFARIHSSTFSVEARPGRLSAILPPVVERLRVLTDARQQHLAVDVPDALPAVYVDARRIGQVISNLVGNAVKFTPSGGAIRIAARHADGLVVVSVTDTGLGIPPEHLSRIFDRFWQAPRPRYSGSGLGLSIAKGIVEAHCGTIWAESQSDRGSTFSFTLVVADDERRSRTAAPMEHDSTTA